MGEKLKNEPLVEAICEFRFSAEAAWDWTIPGQLFDRIKQDFPERSQVQGLGFQLQASSGTPPVATINTGPERVQLKRRDGSAMVQVGPGLLAVNQFPPYPDWETFLSLILCIFNEHQSIASEAELRRVGLRYINQIRIPELSARITDFITLGPPLVGCLDRPLRTFYQRYEIEQEGPESILIHQTGFQESERGPLIVLDLDFGSTKVNDLKSVNEIRDWLNVAHDRLYEAFVASLNPTLYETMKRGGV